MPKPPNNVLYKKDGIVYSAIYIPDEHLLMRQVRQDIAPTFFIYFEADEVFMGDAFTYHYRYYKDSEGHIKDEFIRQPLPEPEKDLPDTW